MPQVACECGKRFRVSDQEAGKSGRCPCGRIVQIPGPPSSETLSVARLEEETIEPDEQRDESMRSLAMNDRLGRYLLESELGAGTMGQVWLACDIDLGRKVAIKVLPSEVRHEQERLRRFQREAKLMAKLDHPNTVSVHHLGDDGHVLYLVMEYVRGGSLEDHLKKSGPLSWREATRAVRDAAAGLAEAHRLKLVHRDIKPSNLLRTPQGMIKVADFGLARELFQETDLTRQGSVLGTPSFMAPEQWQGKPTDARSDLYSLTCTYYFLLTGRPPFEADNWAAVGYLHLHEPFPDPRSRQVEIPAGVWKVLERGSRKDQASRYCSADQMLADLEVLLDQPPAPPPRRAARKAKSLPAAKQRRNWQNVAHGEIWPVAGMVAGVTLLALLLLFWFGGSPRMSGTPPTEAKTPGEGSGADAVASPQEMANATSVGAAIHGLDNVVPEVAVAPKTEISTLAPRAVQRAVCELEVQPPEAEANAMGQGVRIVGQGSKRRIEVDEPVGQQTVEVLARAKGYEELRRQWTVSPGASDEMTLTLRPLPAAYVLDVTPSDSEVLVFGHGARVVGQGASRRVEVNEPTASDIVEIVVRRSDYQEWQQQWRPAPGKEEHQSVQLASLPTITNSLGMKLALIPAGEFMMGSSPDEEDRDEDEHFHRVRITNPFYLGVYEVTQAEYEQVMGTNASFYSAKGKGSEKVAGLDTRRFPVEMVSWEDAVEFCRRLNSLPAEQEVGRVYRLPTEAEWEYACRAGTTAPFHFGRELNGGEANCDGNYPYGTTVRGAFLGRTTTVGSYGANAFGLHDMHGNVWEWCQDWYEEDYYKSSPLENPLGPPTGTNRVSRGGSWLSIGWGCRAAIRFRLSPDFRFGHLGFRVAFSSVDK